MLLQIAKDVSLKRNCSTGTMTRLIWR